MTTTTKNIVVELNKGLKLNGDNYEIWSLKVQYVLEEQEALEAINNVMNEPEEANIAQHRREREAYDSWKKKNSTARITLLSTLDDDILRDFKVHQRVMDLWNALRNRGKKRGPTQAQRVQPAKTAKTEKGKNRYPKRVKVAKVKCYNCDKRGHYARDCSEPPRKT
ncbi:uncharacterized protein [Nicotiana tomentosiformis]|uniref:uncharacterized protein n=1 Tax=Nicotiana tomentosiformis TaxID=4098 RepID=UPI00388CD7AB